jgi:hypothetical protein
MNAFRATYADWKLIKTRGVVQVIFEVPLADHDTAYGVLGGMPDTAKERWFGIAPLNLSQRKEDNPNSEKPPAQPQPVPPAGVRLPWNDVQPAAQSGIRCGEPTFRAFLSEVYGMDTSDKLKTEQAVRIICCVNSRVEFGTDQRKRVLWKQLDTEYQAWLARERVGA